MCWDHSSGSPAWQHLELTAWQAFRHSWEGFSWSVSLTLEDLRKCEQAFQGHLRYYKTLSKWS